MTDPLFITLISVHGLVRAEPELGRDADTGGQVSYVIELARALARRPDVGRVELLTRRIEDPRVGPEYAVPVEDLGDGATLVRLPCGPRRYLHKETLWPHLEGFVDEALRHLRQVGRLPDVIHGHYADAGHVAAALSGCLGVPMVQTGHSLGHVKRERLLAKGLSEESIEKRFRITRRIEAEEVAIDHASLVVASTQQEVDEQYARYASFDAARARVIPPGVCLERFSPPRPREPVPAIAGELERFLSEPGKPLVLSISRADARKNLAGLVEAFATTPGLRERANLALVAGTREDLRALDREARQVLTDLLLEIDRHDLWGHVAIPKQHAPEDVPELYRLAVRRKGVFVNPALTEPFGLTLLEAAASGLPVVATEDGGPRDIIEHCAHGVLVDPLDTGALGRAILDSIDDRAAWTRRSRAGPRGVRRHYSWDAHAQTYVQQLRRARSGHRRLLQHRAAPLVSAQRVLVCDIDDTLTGDVEAARALAERVRRDRESIAFGVATGRELSAAVEELRRWRFPQPDVLITSVGTEIHFGPSLWHDAGWARHIGYRWDREGVVEALDGVSGLTLQGPVGQQRFKVSYDVDADLAPSASDLRAWLRGRGLRVRPILSHGERFLDVLPLRASKGHAVRYVAMKWGLTPDQLLTAGDSGNDMEMLEGGTRGIVVANHSPELERLRESEHVYFAEGRHAAGVLEGLEHYADAAAAS